jgi:methionyl-tRNA synthetase
LDTTFFLTTAIDYTNGAPHLGHAYEKVLADVLARFRRLRGEQVFFLTGVDQHGQKVQQSAEKRGVAPAEFVAEVTAQFVALWAKLGVRYDAWAPTTATRSACRRSSAASMPKGRSSRIPGAAITACGRNSS